MHCSHWSTLLVLYAGAALTPLLVPLVSPIFGAMAVYATLRRRKCGKARKCAEQILSNGFSGIACTPGRLGSYRVSVSPWMCHMSKLRQETAFEPLGGRPLFSFPWPFYLRLDDVAACRVEEGPCRGLVFALADVGYSLRGSVSVSSEWGDWARAELEPAGPGLVKVRMECHLARARGAKLILKVPKPPISVECSESGVREQVVDLRRSEWPVLIVLLGGAQNFDLEGFLGAIPCRWGCRVKLALELPGGRAESNGRAEPVYL